MNKDQVSLSLHLSFQRGWVPLLYKDDRHHSPTNQTASQGEGPSLALSLPIRFWDYKVALVDEAVEWQSWPQGRPNAT